MDNKYLIETLPFDWKTFQANQYLLKEDIVHTSLEAAEKYDIFSRCIKCGLALGCGFIVVKQEFNIPYVVVGIDYNYYEIDARKVSDESLVNIVHSIQNSFVDGIHGHMKADMFNNPK